MTIIVSGDCRESPPAAHLLLALGTTLPSFYGCPNPNAKQTGGCRGISGNPLHDEVMSWGIHFVYVNAFILPQQAAA